MNKRLLMWEAVATLVGTIIGAGILGIPYVISQAGFWTGVADIVVLGGVVLLLYLYMGEVVLRTKGFHQLPGYAGIYLGKLGKRLMVLASLVGNYGALIAYLIGIGAALAAIFGGEPAFYILLFFVIVAIILFIGLKAVGESELIMLPIVVLVITFISIVAFNHIDPINYTEFNLFKILIPYGVILFAFLGAPAIPEMREMLVKNEKLLKRAIIIGSLIPIFAYLIFAIAVVGVTGASTTEIATIGLGESVGNYMVIIGNLLAVLTMSTSFLTLGLALKETFMLDYHIHKHVAWIITCFIPLVIALSGLTTFIIVVGMVGVVAGGMEGALIVLMALKAKKYGNRKPEYSVHLNKFTAALILGLFIFGAAYFFWSSYLL